jgi:hypothetical protein
VWNLVEPEKFCGLTLAEEVPKGKEWWYTTLGWSPIRVRGGEMATRDEASLSDQERAALAHLEARAAADDPQLAGRLRGPGSRRQLPEFPPVPVWTGSGWWALPVALVGLLIMVFSLSTLAVVGVIGALVMAAGLWMGACAVDRDLAAHRDHIE